jgi:hypothetical protein
MGYKQVFHHQKTAAMIGLLGSLLFTLSAFSYLSYAWFTSQKTTSVNFSNMKLVTGFSVKVKYLSYNGQIENGVTTYHGYKRSDITTLDASFSYSSNFLTPEDTTSTGPLGGRYFAPFYASTYCFEITSDEGLTSFQVFLSSFSSPASTTEYSDSLSAYISLSEAVDVYTAYSDGTNLDADAKAFLEATTGDGATDRFSHTGTSLEEGTADSWNPTGTMKTPASGPAYFFVTEYFTNDSATFYSPVSGSANHWVHDVNGTSNPYQGLSIVLSGASVGPGE